jgi:hypothetical protein
MLQLAGKGIVTRKNRTYRSAPLFHAHDERQVQRLLDGGLAAAGLSTRELDSLPGSGVRKVACDARRVTFWFAPEFVCRLNQVRPSSELASIHPSEGVGAKQFPVVNAIPFASHRIVLTG